jgi:hypothetical protein
MRVKVTVFSSATPCNPVGQILQTIRVSVDQPASYSSYASQESDENILYVTFNVSDLSTSDPYDAKQLTHIH